MDNPFFTEEDYPNQFLKGVSIFQDDSRLFHRVGFQYDHLAALESADQKDNALVGSGGMDLKPLSRQKVVYAWSGNTCIGHG